MAVPKLIRDRILEAIAADDGLNVSTLSRRTPIPGDGGVGEKTIQALLDNPGRVPETRVIEAVARALGDDHESYYEWPIAVARRDARMTPKAGRRRAADAARKAARRQSGRQSKPPTDHDEKPGKGQAA